MSNPSIAEVVGDPEWLPHAFDADGKTLTFVRVPRDSRAELMFLFDAHFAGRFKKATFPTVELLAESQSAVRAPMHFIFHTSFAGSTLLARALEIPGVATSMSEPAIYTNLANRVTDRSERAAANRLDLVLRLMERPFAPDESIIVKQSSFANGLAEQILRARTETCAVLLYSDLQTYLLSLLKRGLKGRIWGRKLFTTVRSWSGLRLDLPESELFELTDMQVAALAWLLQIHHFGELTRAFGPRVMPLESDDIFSASATTLHRVSALFGLGLNEKRTMEIAAGPVFAKHSKFTDRDYSPEARQRDSEAAENANSEEISMVVKWLDTFAAHLGVNLRP